MIGQFVEIPEDTAFTEEYSVRAARMAVYSLMDVRRKVIPVTPYWKHPECCLRQCLRRFGNCGYQGTEEMKMGGFSNIKSKLLAEQVQEQIYHYILETPLEPGSKLPNEFELGEKFDVGRSTIREAVKLLVSQGILEVRRGSGTYVVNTTPSDLDPLGLSGAEDKMALALDLSMCG